MFCFDLSSISVTSDHRHRIPLITSFWCTNKIRRLPVLSSILDERFSPDEDLFFEFLLWSVFALLFYTCFCSRIFNRFYSLITFYPITAFLYCSVGFDFVQKMSLFIVYYLLLSSFYYCIQIMVRPFCLLL